ncbi:hypothetical protein N9850_01165 [Granulosicoccus sp.]|nr:hypothetical protein [Granulosicoccus sp.]MDB4222353.1 hypothetical protein [Granulosicoccus sp.]
MIIDYIETCIRREQDVFGISNCAESRAASQLKIIEFETYCLSADRHNVLPCAFGPRRRFELWQLAESIACQLATTLVDPTAILPSSLRLGLGGFVNAGVVIGGESFVGDGVVINRAASLGHHCLIGDWVSIGPGATLAGNIRIEPLAVVGAGATILPDVRVGRGSVIAAGSVVREHVGENTLVAGNPAMPRKYDVEKNSLNIVGEE